MARGIKGSGKTAKTTSNADKKPKATKPASAKKPAVTSTPDTAAAKAARKPYPSLDERIKLGESAISKLTSLYESREKLVQKTEATLTERKTVLARIATDLEKAKAKQEKLFALQQKKTNKPAASAKKLSAEERKAARQAAVAAAREAKKAKSAKMAQLLEKLDQSGLTLDEMINKLEK